MIMKNMLAATAMVAAITANAQAQQYVIVQNPEIQLSSSR